MLFDYLHHYKQMFSNMQDKSIMYAMILFCKRFKNNNSVKIGLTVRFLKMEDVLFHGTVS